ncbi:hypothetical protein E3J79_03105 [Candidatus Dependentiae bacterium]|nr:MAG: hypothetical protein E3J79_03105 [Candidatus Dependentiae bacterium]
MKRYSMAHFGVFVLPLLWLSTINIVTLPMEEYEIIEEYGVPKKKEAPPEGWVKIPRPKERYLTIINATPLPLVLFVQKTDGSAEEISLMLSPDWKVGELSIQKVLSRLLPQLERIIGRDYYIVRPIDTLSAVWVKVWNPLLPERDLIKQLPLETVRKQKNPQITIRLLTATWQGLWNNRGAWQSPVGSPLVRALYDLGRNPQFEFDTQPPALRENIFERAANLINKLLGKS